MAKATKVPKSAPIRLTGAHVAARLDVAQRRLDHLIQQYPFFAPPFVERGEGKAESRRAMRRYWGAWQVRLLLAVQAGEMSADDAMHRHEQLLSAACDPWSIDEVEIELPALRAVAAPTKAEPKRGRVALQRAEG